jgi:hypothetical protein
MLKFLFCLAMPFSRKADARGLARASLNILTAYDDAKAVNLEMVLSARGFLPSLQGTPSSVLSATAVPVQRANEANTATISFTANSLDGLVNLSPGNDS